MAAVAMVIKVQNILNSLQTADLFENFPNGHRFKMAAKIKIRKIVKNSKMKRFQWKWIFTGSKTCCTILQPFRFAMAAIANRNNRQNTKIRRFGRNCVLL
jgi:hypothetical protein